jgi:hypothetical protein
MKSPAWFVLLLTATIVLFLCPPATAQMEPGSVVVTGNLGAMVASVKEFDSNYAGWDENYTAWGLNLSVEKILSNPHISLGFSLAYLTVNKDHVPSAWGSAPTAVLSKSPRKAPT